MTLNIPHQYRTAAKGREDKSVAVLAHNVSSLFSLLRQRGQAIVLLQKSRNVCLLLARSLDWDNIMIYFKMSPQSLLCSEWSFGRSPDHGGLYSSADELTHEFIA